MKHSKSLGVLLAAMVLLWGGCSPASSELATIRITPKDICFRQWRDLAEFNAKLLQSMERAVSVKEFFTMSDAEAADAGKRTQREFELLKDTFAADGRLWEIPPGTEIRISKYYDRMGNETKPVWNEARKTAYTPDGNAVYVSGEWEGKIVYTLLTR